MAAPPTPLPQRARAVIVGIESYDLRAAAPGLESTTRIPDLQGVIDDALRLAASLQSDLGLAAADVDLWLSPATQQSDGRSGHVHAFTRDGFQDFLTKTLAQDVEGGLLLLFWSGHGVIDDDHHTRLLLPGSTTRKPLDFDAEDICKLLLGEDLARFTHQVLVFNACRVTALNAGIEGRLNNTQLPAERPTAGRPVSQLKVYGCSLAESSRQAKDGAALLRALRTGWTQPRQERWPDFEQRALDAAQRVAEATDEDQRPQVIGWAGNALSTPRRTLRSLLGALGWLTEDFRELALRCLRASDRRERLDDLTSLLAALEDLQPAADVHPLHEFVARVLAQVDKAFAAGILSEVGSKARAELHSWYDRNTDGTGQAQIQQRLKDDAPLHVLQLWVEDTPPGVKAALMDSNGGALFTDWDIHEVRSFDPADPASLLLELGDCIKDALARVGQPLLLELFLPTSRLAAGIDGSTVTAGDDDYAIGMEMPAFLRAMDRHKSNKRRTEWAAKATTILGRYVSTKLLLHWSSEPADADVIRSEFAKAHAQGAVWLGLPAAPAPAAMVGGVRVARAFDHALDSGVPSMLWLRGGAACPSRDVLDAALTELLRDAASNLPRTLRDWRALHAATLRGEPALLLDDPARPPPFSTHVGRDSGPRF